MHSINTPFSSHPSCRKEPHLNESIWIGFDDDARTDPRLARRKPLLIGFEDEAQPTVEDHLRAAPAPPIRGAWAVGVLASLSLHAAALLPLLNGPASPLQSLRTIPAQLVIEQPTVSASPPSLTPPAALPSATIPKAIASPPRPALEFPSSQPVRQLAMAPGLATEVELASNAVPGPDATRSQYLAYLVTLARHHLGLLPPSLVGNRHGETILEMLVRSDGSIARIVISHGSGYPDIDARVKQIVTAVGQFPPLPRWFRDPAMELNFRFRFPDALRDR